MNRLLPRRLRTRVTLVATLVALGIMTLAGAAMLAYQENQLFDAVDAALEESIEETSGEFGIQFGQTRRRGSGQAQRDLDIRFRDSDRSLQLLDAEGDVISASGSAVGEPALVDTADVLDDPQEPVDEFATVEGNESRYRIAATSVNDDRVLVVAYPLADVDESLETQRLALLLGIPLLSGVLGLLIWFVLGRALTPVETMREEVSSVEPTDLGRRVDVPENSVELAALATTLNAMLDRLDDSITRQNQFVSDAAHELRSPLAGVRGQLEVNVHHPDAPDRAASEEEMLAETIRMQELVDDLLLLARADSGRLERPSTPVDLDDLVLEETARIDRADQLAVNVEQVSGAQVTGDATQLRRVIRNLLDNATRHAGSSIWVELGEDAGGARLAVVDDGPGVPAGKVESVFDRFTRLDESRSRDAGGSGLGLAISREIVEHHGGTIRVDTEHAGGARFVVEIPFHDAPST